jgi:hypothetical protein
MNNKIRAQGPTPAPGDTSGMRMTDKTELRDDATIAVFI